MLFRSVCIFVMIYAVGYMKKDNEKVRFFATLLLFAAAMQTWPSNAEARRGQSPDKKSWWWVIHDDYVVSFHELPGYRVYLRKPYTRWLPPGRGQVLILVREKPHVAFVPKP